MSGAACLKVILARISTNVAFQVAKNTETIIFGIDFIMLARLVFDFVREIVWSPVSTAPMLLHFLDADLGNNVV